MDKQNHDMERLKVDDSLNQPENEFSRVVKDCDKEKLIIEMLTKEGENMK